MGKNLLLVPFGVVMGVLLLEGGLQVAAWAVQRSTRSEFPVAWMTGNLRVLCLGDSNTYGLYLERHEAWPAQLERLWNEGVEAPKLEVMNLGFPGTNSSRLVRDLPRLLDTFAPDAVLVMVGVNDFWTAPFEVPISALEEGPGFVQRHSLLYRLFALARRGRHALEVEKRPDSTLRAGGYQVRYGDEEFEMDFRRGAAPLAGERRTLAGNLADLVEIAERAGTPIHLLNYPGRKDFYDRANHVVRQLARASGASFVDVAAAFDSRCPSPECSEWLFDDQHPRAPAQRIVAELVLPRLLRQVAPERGGAGAGDRGYSGGANRSGS